MRCYSCGCELSEKDFCTSCRADVGLYKRIMYASNRFYNDGLEKANVRDLTGAIVSLRQSLKFNKYNIEARNLLGLVYFEMGEVVAALSEWVISKNLQSEKNIADDYINMIQANPGRLESINQTIKKYNQALVYCRQDSKDLAVIQLKKVLSLNPRFIRAHQLLALLYLNNEEWEKARRELNKCVVIDNNNTTTLRYLKEAERMLMPDETGKASKKRKNEPKEAVKYQSGNETIIQPVNVREPKGSSAMLNLFVGLAIGLAAACFLILPAKVQNEKAKINDELRIVSEQADAKTATITELESKLKGLQQERDSLKEQVESYLGTEGSLELMDELLLASKAYLTNPEDMITVEEHLSRIAFETDVKETSAAFQDVYGILYQSISPQLATLYYTEGYDAYEKEQYTEAIEKLGKAWEYDETNVDALYYLGNAYRKNDNPEQAIEIYSQVIELFPGTARADKADQYRSGLQN